MKRLLSAIILCVFLDGALASAAVADTAKSWMGTVAYLNTSRLGVKADSQTKDFMVGDFTEVFENGKKMHLSDVKVGATVTVQYSQSTMFGATRVTRIDLMVFKPRPPKSLPTLEPHVAS